MADGGKTRKKSVGTKRGSLTAKAGRRRAKNIAKDKYGSYQAVSARNPNETTELGRESGAFYAAAGLTKLIRFHRKMKMPMNLGYGKEAHV